MIRVVCEMENLKNEFFDDLIEKNESYIVSKWILHRIPYIFEENLLAYINWKEKLSEKIGVDSRAICITGSSCIGFSINPNKGYKCFNEKSDIDIAIVSNHYFDLSWHYLRNMGTERYRLNEEQKESVKDHVNRLIYWGTIATDKILPILPFGNGWVIALNEMANEEITRGRDIKVRIYKDYESFRAYNIQNIKNLKSEYLKNKIKQEEIL